MTDAHVAAGVHALEPLLPGMTLAQLTDLAQAVITAVNFGGRCRSVSSFHGTQCVGAADGHVNHCDSQARSWHIGLNALVMKEETHG